MERLLTALKRRFSRVDFASEEGFSMLAAAMAIVVTMLMATAAWNGVNADSSEQNTNAFQNAAYAEAQTGVTDYISHMAQDQNYYTYCDTPTLLGSSGTGLGDIAINDTDTGQTATHPQRRWLPYYSPGSANDNTVASQYTIDLIPANGVASCKTGTDPTAAMVDSTSGSVTVRVTGRAGGPVPSLNGGAQMPNPANPAGAAVARTATNIEAWRQKFWKRRSIIVQFRQNGFLDYAYFTDHEAMDPGLYSGGSAGKCVGYFNVGTDSPANWRRNKATGTDCGTSELAFASGDKINGPFHTNDSVLLQSFNSTLFGRPGKADKVEIYDQGFPTSNTNSCPVRTDSGGGGYSDASGGYTCSHNDSDINNASGTQLLIGDKAPFLQLPEDNSDLVKWAQTDNGGYTYTGPTTITLSTGGKMTVTSGGVTQTNIAYPASGVVYVANPSGVACDSTPKGLSGTGEITTYPFMPATCGYVEVKGTYDQSLTIGSQSDVIISGDITRASGASSAVLGLIANKFVRVRHYSSSGTCGNTSSTPTGTTVNNIQAAILSISHSFTVDRYDCGSALGTLNITGAIAQAYRGPVAIGGSSGYVKNYTYDDRLKFLTPPHFLTPEESQWVVSRIREQAPACPCTSKGG